MHFHIFQTKSNGYDDEELRAKSHSVSDEDLEHMDISPTEVPGYISKMREMSHVMHPGDEELKQAEGEEDRAKKRKRERFRDKLMEVYSTQIGRVRMSQKNMRKLQKRQ